VNALSWAALAAIAGALVLPLVRRGALLSLTLAIAIVLVYIFDYASAFFPGPTVAQEIAWFHAPGAELSPLWTILTTNFVHGGTTHLMFNLLGFVLITPILEERIGSLRWAVVFFAGALAGEFVFWAVRYQEGWILFGASSGLFAVLGAFARLFPRERVTLFLPFPGLPAVPVLYLALGYLLLNFAFLAGSFSRVAWEAHLGGLGFGLVAAPLVMRIPAGGPAKLAALNVAALEPLATTRELRQILDELKRADVPEVRAAWLGQFAAKARCPTCGGPVRIRRNRLTSTCGWRQPV